MKKKTIIIVGIILSVLVALGIITGYLDYKNVKNNIEPKYTLKTISNGGEKVTYWGLGYKVIRYTNNTPSEPFNHSKFIKFGSWLLRYDVFMNNDQANKYNDYRLVSELKKVNYASTEVLVRFDGVLYGKSNALIDYAAGSEKIGIIDKLIDSKYVPKLNNETNTKEILNASVYDKTDKSLILNYNNEYVLFEKINE